MPHVVRVCDRVWSSRSILKRLKGWLRGVSLVTEYKVIVRRQKQNDLYSIKLTQKFGLAGVMKVLRMSFRAGDFTSRRYKSRGIGGGNRGSGRGRTFGEWTLMAAVVLAYNVWGCRSAC